MLIRIELYKPGNTDYEHNGDMPLLPESASVKAILNGSWKAEIQHPIDEEGRWKWIEEDAVVKLESFNGTQLFRIKKKAKSDAGVSAELEPVFMDAIDDCFLLDIRPTEKNGQQALDIMTELESIMGCRFYTGKTLRKTGCRKRLIPARSLQGLYQRHITDT